MATATAASNKAGHRLVSITEAADYLGVSTKTVRRYLAAGRFEALRAGPKLIRIRQDDLDAMLRPIPTTGRDRAS